VGRVCYPPRGPRMRHDHLRDAGRTPHRDIDKQLPSPDEKMTLQKLLREQKFEIVAEGNTRFDQDGNWRLVINSNGDLDLERRESGSWTTKATWT
ncbi:MAG: hypothetical protein ACOC58_03395, partial [Chloroflexota bacterium]